MKRRLTLAASADVLALSAVAGTASADAPADPGCFGTDRAADNQVLIEVGPPGASEGGAIKAMRAGENGEINRAYMLMCGGTPL